MPAGNGGRKESESYEIGFKTTRWGVYIFAMLSYGCSRNAGSVRHYIDKDVAQKFYPFFHLPDRFGVVQFVSGSLAGPACGKAPTRCIVRMVFDCFT